MVCLEDAHKMSLTAQKWETYRFTSKEFDRETGLYYYGARYYEPKLSNWMSVDPAGFELINPMDSDGKPRKGYNIIEALNWYAYAGNNPVIYVDPTGLLIEWIQDENVSDEEFAKAQEMGENIKNSDTEAGKRWRAAEDSDKTVFIYVNKDRENKSIPGDDEKRSIGEDLASGLGIGGDAYILFDPTDESSMSDGSPGSPESTLAHEMAHAYLQINGRIPWFSKGRELDGTAVDNQYRDHLGVDQRGIYGKGVVDWNAPQYNRDTGKYTIYGTGKPYRLRKVR